MLEQDPTFRGTTEIDLEGGFAVVTVTDQGTDAIDNDDNLMIDDEPEQGILGMRSEGWYQPGSTDTWQRSVVLVTVREKTTTFQSEQVVYLDDPYGGVKLGYGDLAINGSDSSESGSSVYPIGTPGSPEAIMADLGQTSLDSRTDQSLVGQTTDLDLLKKIDEFKGAHDVAISPDSQTTLTNSEPALIYAEGNLTLEDSNHARGVLVVDGDLTLVGDLSFEGLILVRGKLTLDGCTKVAGSILVQGEGDNLEQPAIRMRNTACLYHSSSALETAAEVMPGGLELLTWEHESSVHDVVAPPVIEDPLAGYPTDWGLAVDAD
jgi:hypothetical protein